MNGVPWWYFHGLGGPYEGRRIASVDPGDGLWDGLGPERVIGCVVYPAAEVVEPGVVEPVEGDRFTLGEPSGARSAARRGAVAGADRRRASRRRSGRSIRDEIWVKLWGNLSFNPISALTGATLDAICADPGTRALARAMMVEAQAIAREARRALPDRRRPAHRRRGRGRRAQDLDAAGPRARPADGDRRAGDRGGGDGPLWSRCRRPRSTLVLALVRLAGARGGLLRLTQSREIRQAAATAGTSTATSIGWLGEDLPRLRVSAMPDTTTGCRTAAAARRAARPTVAPTPF